MFRVASILLGLSLVGACSAQNLPDDAAKHQDTKRLMEAVGTTQLLQQMIDQTLEQQLRMLRRARPEVPPRFWQNFMKEARQEASPQELMDLIVPIYDRHFTHEEIRQMIAFYETPLGKKISATLPEIQQESLQVGQEWGESLGERLNRRVKERLNDDGYKPLAQSRPAARSQREKSATAIVAALP
jgi:uncharacterized protein